MASWTPDAGEGPEPSDRLALGSHAPLRCESREEDAANAPTALARKTTDRSQAGRKLPPPRRCPRYSVILLHARVPADASEEEAFPPVSPAPAYFTQVLLNTS